MRPCMCKSGGPYVRAHREPADGVLMLRGTDLD